MANHNETLEARTLQLANVLQSSLDLSKLIVLFGEELAELVPFDGLRFDNTEDGIDIVAGQVEGHSVNYRLVLLDNSLGQMSVWREQPFNNRETENFEAMLCALVYPLRNALMYKRALETALRDPVTGISNRAAMDSALDREIDLAQRHDNPLSVIMLDIDRFKRINDTYGHLAGDSVLKDVADCITECVRRSDVVFRYGGEEFVVILSNTERFGATLLAQRVREAVEHLELSYDDELIDITVSVGVTNLEENDSAADLLDKADRALYQAKEGGRNRVVEFAA